MQTTLTSLNAIHRPMSAATGSNELASSERPAALVESTELLRGNKTVGIMHNGSLYRLQATKLGKLILTK
ncbi:MAG: hemin uptake protein HemP [Proteobacteria bacterium]|nr:hemin uptake protein HemP [Pseudomonadota bacterium]